MKTEHEQLIELEPLMQELGWWSERITRNYSGWEYRSDLWLDDESDNPSPTFHILEPEDALSIVVRRAEEELCERGWYPSDDWGTYRPSWFENKKHSLADAWGTDRPSWFENKKHSLADALRVEIERQSQLGKELNQ